MSRSEKGRGREFEEHEEREKSETGLRYEYNGREMLLLLPQPPVGDALEPGVCLIRPF